MSAARVTIIGSALSGNKGAAAMLESAVQTLGSKFPDITFSLLSMYPREDAAQISYPSIEIIPASRRRLGVTKNLIGY